MSLAGVGWAGQSERGLGQAGAPPLPGVLRVLGNPMDHGGGPDLLAFSNDGRILLVGAYEGLSRAYDVETGELLLDSSSYQLIESMTSNPAKAEKQVSRFILSTLGSMIGTLMGLGPGMRPKLTAAGKKRARQLAGPTGLPDFDLAARLVRRPPDEMESVLSPDGRVWATTDDEERFVFMDARTGQPIAKPKPRPAGVAGVFSREARLFADEVKTGTVGVWEVASGQLRHRLKSHSGAVQALAFAPDAGFLASAGEDGAVVLWDLEAGEWRARQVGWEDGVDSMTFVPHPGRLLLAIAGSGTLGLFDLPSLAPVTRLGARGGGALWALGIAKIAASPDGRLLAAGPCDETAHLLDVAELVANPKTIARDPVHLSESGPRSQEEERQAAAAFRELLEARLAELDATLAEEMAAIVAGVKPGTVRVAFYYEPWELSARDCMTWSAEAADGSELAGGKMATFRKAVLPQKVLEDPRYASSEAVPSEVLAERIPRWMARHWRAAAPERLPGVLVPSESDEVYNLHADRWIEAGW